MSGVPGRDAYTVNEVVERPGFGAPLLKIIGLCFLLMVCDSYDVAALSFAAPALIKDWHLSPSSMGVVFSAGLFGLLVGSVAFGRLGDRLGRKRAIILGALTFSVLTAATGLAASYEQLLALRFLAALGLGGAVPNAVALITEFAPQRLRITAVGAIFAGYSVGGIVAGLSAAYVIPAHGWQMMFYAGGALSLLAAIAFILLLPESLRYLVTVPSRAAEALKVAAFLRPDLRFDAGARVIPDNAAASTTPGRVSDLFAGVLQTATPLVWLTYIASSMTVFSLSSWMPVAVEAVGLSRGSAALATSLLFAGSAVGGVVGGRFADRFGIAAVVAMAVLACPAVAAIGMLDGASSMLFPVVFLAGFFAFGVQTCLHGVVGSLYPTRIRANGVGWAIGIAKIGSMLGPYVGGLLIAGLTSQQLFMAAASPLVLVAVLAFALRMVLANAAVTADRHAPVSVG